ncbi:hypothetical protein LJC07_04110 [Christensenellaceae bacterium OttesenSCG-928-L17]|nr:hypothetical protein [Christensenellaceae bacterium OttesenSCG-928-L17]
MPKKANETPSPLRRKLDQFWTTLFLTPEGRPKSAKLLYTFCLSIVFMLVYGLCYWFLTDPLEAAFQNASPFVRRLFEAIVPGLLGSALCCLFWFVFKDKSYLPTIYTWLAVFALAVLITLLFLTEEDLMGMMLQLYAMLVPTGLISGSVFSWYMYVRWRRSRPAVK